MSDRERARARRRRAQLQGPSVLSQQAAPSGPPPESFLAGVNRGVGGLLDLPSKPYTVPAQMLGANVTTSPFTDLMRGAGAIPAERNAGLASRIGEGVGGAILPGAGLEAAAGRVAPQAASGLLRSIQTNPGAWRAGEAAAALGSGAGAQVGEMVGGPAGEAVGGIAGALAPSGLAGTARLGTRGPNTAGTRSAIADAEQAGIDYTAGQVGQAAPGRVLEASIDKLPGANVVSDVATRRMGEQFGSRLTDLTPGATDSSTAGLTLKQGVKDHVTRFNDEAEQRYGDFYDLVESRQPPGQEDVGVALDETLGELGRLATPDPAAANIGAQLVNPKLNKYLDALTKDASGTGTIPWSSVRKLRSKIGRMIGNPGLHADEPIAELKEVYAALSDDMRAAAGTLGDDVAQAWTGANDFFREGVGHIDDNLNKLVKSEIPNTIFDAFERSTKKGRTLAEWYKDALSPEQWGTVRDTTLRNLGESNPSAEGDFAIDTFFTRWKDLDDRAKNLLLPEGAGLRGDFDQLARIADRARRSSRTVYNPSGTAGKLATMGAAATMMSAVATGNSTLLLSTLAPLVGSAATMKLLTTPGVAKWLARPTNAAGYTQVPQRVAALEKLVEDADPEAQEAARALVQGLAPGP